MLKTALLSLLLALSCSVVAETLDGLWRLEDKPVWITIASDTGLVSYSKDDPDAQGKTLLRNLRVTNVGNRWQGQIYVKQLKAYTDADIILTSSDSMDINVKVGFMRRKVTWQRSTETPKLREE
jgi:hypothetical protein